MFRKPHYIATFFVVLLVVVLLELPSRTVGHFKMAIGGFFLPLFGLAGAGHDLAEKTGDSLTSRGELLRENSRLHLQVQELQLALQQRQAAANENTRLSQLLGWQPPSDWRFKAAHVIAHDPANWWHSIEIDLGARDQMQPGLPVVTGDGLVGKVNAVGETRSQVLLLGDPNLQVSAQIETNGDMGVVLSSSSSPEENNMVDLGFLSGNSVVRPGQEVKTSGDGGVFPPGLVIGKVVDARKKDYGMSTEARVQLAANLSALEEVLVKLPDESQLALPQSVVTPPKPPPASSRPMGNIQHPGPGGKK